MCLPRKKKFNDSKNVLNFILENLSNEYEDIDYLKETVFMQRGIIKGNLNDLDGAEKDINESIEIALNSNEISFNKLLGDFNALTRSDYNVKEWSDIFKVRKYGQWELPVHELTDKLREEWYDCGKHNPSVTSRYNTRIDYIYTKNMNILHYNIEETMPSISDHNLVMMRFGI